MDPCGLKINWIPVLVRETVPPIITGAFPGPEMFQSCGVVPSLAVLLTCLHGVRRTRALLRATSVMTSFVVGLVITLEVSPPVATLSIIQGSIDVVMIGRFR